MKNDFQNEFWDFLNPVLVKELRQGLRSGWFTKTFITTQLILGFICISQAVNAMMILKLENGDLSDILGGVFWFILGFVLLLRAPLSALNAVSLEIQGKTIELLALTQQTSHKILWGKWISIMLQSLLLVVSILPYGMIRYYFGKVNISDELLIIGAMIAASGLFVALGLSISALHNSIKAIFTFVSFIFLTGFGAEFIRSSMLTHAEWLPTLMILGGGLILIGFLLELGASWIAPISENMAFRLRACGLLAWGWVLLGSFLDLGKPIAGILLGEACLISIFLLLNGLRDLRTVQWAHVRGFLAWPRLIRWSEIFFYAGWQSALAYALLFLILTTGIMALTSHSENEWQWAGMGFLTITTLTFPMLIIGRAWWRWGDSLITYLVFQLALAAPLMALIPIALFKPSVFHLIALLPSGSWILGLYHVAKKDFFTSTEWDLPGRIFLEGILVHSIFLILLLVASAPYWKRILAMKKRRGSIE